MSTRRFALPLLGPVGITLTTLAVGFYSYKYWQSYRTRLRPRPRTHSGHTTQFLTQNNVTPRHPTQPPIQNNLPTLRPAPDTHTTTLALLDQFPSQTQNLVLPQQNSRMSLRDHQTLSPADLPQSPTHLRITDSDDYLGEELARELAHRFVFSIARLGEKSCHVQVNERTRTIQLMIKKPTSRDALELQYKPCSKYLKKSSRDATTVVATVGQIHASSLLSLIRLRKMLERLAADDTNHRCKSLMVNLPDMGSTSDVLNEAYPGLLPLTTALPGLENLHWTSSWKQLHLMAPDALSHLTNLTLASQISFRDAIYLLHCVRETLRKCSLNDVYDYANDSINVFQDPGFTSVMLNLMSFSVHAKSSASSRLLLNRLEFPGKQLSKMTLEVENDPVNPEELQTIPWADIGNITLKCNLVTGGDAWVRREAVRAAKSRKLFMRPPTRS
ncbi:hypothetical protein H0H93_000934 [Arthromyces matolae]|nr:hypothetical protein H0H93_000934 [Arthromyces matolae]